MTSDYLLRGAFYALEQCGFLLCDARSLYDKQSYATARVLAAFAREELGRCRILLDLRKDVEGGKTVTLSEIKKRCEDHVEKQHWSQLAIVQRATGDQGLAKLLKTRMQSDPQSPEYKKADRELNDITERQKKRTPEERHKLRLSALYVEPDDLGTAWNRPQDISQGQSANVLEDAANAYLGVYQQIEGPMAREIASELFTAFAQWPNRPRLPRPC